MTRKQKLSINRSLWNWEVVTGGVAQELVLGPQLLTMPMLDAHLWFLEENLVREEEMGEVQ